MDIQDQKDLSVDPRDENKHFRSEAYINDSESFL
jgi:hypothetical protein